MQGNTLIGGHDLIDMFKDVKEFGKTLNNDLKSELEGILNKYDLKDEHLKKSCEKNSEFGRIDEFKRKYGEWSDSGLMINDDEFVYLDLNKFKNVVVHQNKQGKEISSKEYGNVPFGKISVLGKNTFAYIGENNGMNATVVNLNNEFETEKYEFEHAEKNAEEILELFS